MAAKAKAKPKADPPAEPERPLRLEWRTPEELAANPKNWRRHPEQQLTALNDAISEVGWAGACLYNERTGRLIDGHARKTIAHQNGSPVVPVLVGSWTEEQEAKILATLDPLSAMAQTDQVALDSLVKDFKTDSQALQDMLAALYQRQPVDPANDPNAEWQGMPEFAHDDQTPHQTIHVHFPNAESVARFAELLQQPITDQTIFIWFPPREIAVAIDKRYESATA